MSTTPPAYLELTFEHDDKRDTFVDVIAPGDAFVDEDTQRLDFDKPALSGEEKLVVGYLTMEQHGMFAGLSVEEQEQIAENLKS